MTEKDIRASVAPLRSFYGFPSFSSKELRKSLRLRELEFEPAQPDANCRGEGGADSCHRLLGPSLSIGSSPGSSDRRLRILA